MLNQMVDLIGVYCVSRAAKAEPPPIVSDTTSLGPTVLRRSEKAAVRAAAEAQLAQEREKADQLLAEERYRSKLIVAQE